MSLPGYNTNMSYLGDLQQYHEKHTMFSIPPPPPLVVPPPPFDRDISPPRKRTRTSPEQLAILEKSFSTNPSPNNRVREQLSHQLGMPERSIQIWFQNRRAKVKNQAKRTMQMKDSALYNQQQYAASAAAAACQSAAFQQQRDTIDPNLYYYYYYYYFHQQQQGNITPVPSTSYSTPTTSWSNPMAAMVPDLTLSASTSSSSTTSDNHHHHRRHPHPHHHHRSSSASSVSERTRAHSVGPYPYYRKSTPQERHSSLGPPLTPNTSLTQNIPPLPPPPANQFLYHNESRLYNSTIIEEPYSISTSVKPEQKFNLSAQTLQIGSWKRVCDLTCQIDLGTRTIIWCIGDEQQKFRIDINLNLIQYIKTSQHRLEFFLSSPLQIKFYMTTSNDSWVQCHDFTQDKQASLENVHVLESFDEVLQSQFMDLLMQAPELQSLVIQEEESNTMDSNLLLLQGLHLPQH
ncbi:hypothetical protein BDF21DRAFT_384740 [Thamnidium elegans]|nr:hypothetical protein BDF21DRAFT_384740 [Thamnidium elegans]